MLTIRPVPTRYVAIRPTPSTKTDVDTDPAARMAGYYKGVQSAGAAVSFGMDAVRVSHFPNSS